MPLVRIARAGQTGEMSEKPAPLHLTTRVTVRFKESDLLGVVWHGHYVAYLEDARQALGALVGLGYADIVKEGYIAPVVELSLKYKSPARYGDKIDVRCSFHYAEVPKLVATYELRRASDGELLATAESVQVLTDTAGKLVLNFPDFLKEVWQRWRDGAFNLDPRKDPQPSPWS